MLLDDLEILLEAQALHRVVAVVVVVELLPVVVRRELLHAPTHRRRVLVKREASDAEETLEVVDLFLLAVILLLFLELRLQLLDDAHLRALGHL